jgi:hypothetical protein
MICVSRQMINICWEVEVSVVVKNYESKRPSESSCQKSIENSIWFAITQELECLQWSLPHECQSRQCAYCQILQYMWLLLTRYNSYVIILMWTTYLEIWVACLLSI